MTTPAMVRIRFRRTVTLGENVHQANSIETVEATDEAWALVDTGAADLEPASGIGGQPFPPWAQPKPPEAEAKRAEAKRAEPHPAPAHPAPGHEPTEPPRRGRPL